MCDSCDWQGLADRIEDLLDNPKSEFARDSLEGIYTWLEDNEHSTEKQHIAVSNIGDAVER